MGTEDPHIRDKITTVEKGMNFLEKAYGIQTMLMNILRETKEEHLQITERIESLGENTVAVDVGI